MKWDRRLYFPSEGRRAEDFFSPEKSDGFGRVWTRELGYQRPARYLQTTEAASTVSLTHILISFSKLRLDVQGHLFPSGFVTKCYMHFASLPRRNTHRACSMILVIPGKWRIIPLSRPVTVLPEENQEKFHVYGITQTRKRITSGKHGHMYDVIFYYVACHVMVPGRRGAQWYTRLTE